MPSSWNMKLECQLVSHCHCVSQVVVSQCQPVGKPVFVSQSTSLSDSLSKARDFRLSALYASSFRCIARQRLLKIRKRKRMSGWRRKQKRMLWWNRGNGADLASTTLVSARDAAGKFLIQFNLILLNSSRREYWVTGHDNICKHASAACRQGLTFVGRKGIEKAKKLGKGKKENKTKK